MKVNFSPYSNFNFGKTYLRPAVIRKTGGGVADVDFVEYNPKDKKDREQISYLKIAWGEREGFIKDIYNAFVLSQKQLVRNHRFYGLEDKSGTTLAIAEATDKKDGRFSKYTYIDYVQAAPNMQYSIARPGRYKGVGETLIGKIVEKAKEDNKDFIKLVSVNDNFWNSSGFFKDYDVIAKLLLTDKKRLSRKDFDSYISYVEAKKAAAYTEDF